MDLRNQMLQKYAALRGQNAAVRHLTGSGYGSVSRGFLRF